MLDSQSETRRSAFTLVEIITVVALMLILLAVAAPHFVGTSPRRAAFVQLKAAVESARAEAIRTNNEVFIAFTDNLSGTTIDDSYRYSHYAVFSRDLDDPNRRPSDRYFFDQTTCNLIQVQGWTALPTGTMFAIGTELPARVSAGAVVQTIVDGNQPTTQSSAVRSFPFEPAGSGLTQTLPFIMFNGEGRVKFPQFYETDFLHVGVVEGFCEGDQVADRVITAKMAHPTISGQQIPVSEAMAINLYSGRTRIISVNR